MRRWIGSLLLIAMFATLSGCFLFTPPGGGAPQLLYSDDFSDGNSPGWWQGEDSFAEWAITGGRYYGWVIDEDSYYYVYNTTVQGLSDFRIQAKTGQLGTATDHSWGIIFRADDEEFYAFEISADGYVLFSAYSPTNWEDLYGWEPCAAIRPAGQTNEIRVDVRGTTFTMYVNGQLVAEVSDATWSAGSVGFIIETWNDPEGGAWFDDLEVWSLEQQQGIPGL